MELIEIRDKYNAGYYTYNHPEIPNKVREDHVFDEDLSVKRNRELAIEHNQKVDELRKEAREKQNMLHWQLTEDVINYITESYNLNEVQARMVERFTYNEKHAFMCDYFAYIDIFAEFADQLINNSSMTEV